MGPCISSDYSMMSMSYSSYSRESCWIEDSLADIHQMMSLGYHSKLCPSRSVEEVFQPIGKPLMIHLNKTEEGRWTGMIFIPRFHNIYCLYFHLKHEGMNYIDDNFKISRIIGVTNMIVKMISNVLVFPKKCLSKCRDKLQRAYEYLWDQTLQISS